VAIFVVFSSILDSGVNLCEKPGLFVGNTSDDLYFHRSIACFFNIGVSVFGFTWGDGFTIVTFSGFFTDCGLLDRLLLGRRILVEVQPFLVGLVSNSFAFFNSASFGSFFIASSSFDSTFASLALFLGDSIAHTAFLPPDIATAHTAIGVTIGASEEAPRSPRAVVSSIISVLGIHVALCIFVSVLPIREFACFDHFRSTLSRAI
jgi:hypothetical protein